VEMGLESGLGISDEIVVGFEKAEQVPGKGD
jgi:hypothetical protein